MTSIVTPQALLLSLQRALLGEVHPQLRQASIQANASGRVVHIRFEYDGHPLDMVRTSCSTAAAAAVAGYSGSWDLDEQHISIPAPAGLSPLVHVAYRRAEPQHTP